MHAKAEIENFMTTSRKCFSTSMSTRQVPSGWCSAGYFNSNLGLSSVQNLLLFLVTNVVKRERCKMGGSGSDSDDKKMPAKGSGDNTEKKQQPTARRKWCAAVVVLKIF